MGSASGRARGGEAERIQCLRRIFEEGSLGVGAPWGGTMNRNLPRVAYRPREAAEATGLSLRFVYYAIQHKDLLTIRVGRWRLIIR